MLIINRLYIGIVRGYIMNLFRYLPTVTHDLNSQSITTTKNFLIFIDLNILRFRSSHQLTLLTSRAHDNEKINMHVGLRMSRVDRGILGLRVRDSKVCHVGYTHLIFLGCTDALC